MRKDFFISFFVGYILSFGLVRLRTFRLSARVGAHIERRCSRSRREDVTIIDAIIKKTNSKWNWGCEWCHARKIWAGVLGYFEQSSYLIFEPRRVQLGLGCAPRVVRSDGTVSIVKIVSLSLSSCWKPKTQEGNKSFVTELKKVVSVSRDSYVCEYFMHYERFTYPYISRINIWLCYTECLTMRWEGCPYIYSFD